VESLTTRRPDEERANGAVEPESLRSQRSDARRGMIAQRTPWLDLPFPFDNLEIRVWLDYPKHIADLWTPPDNETADDRAARTMLACQNTFLDHRAACDHRGDPQTCREEHEPWWLPGDDVPLPECSDSEFWERIPTPLFRAIVDRFVEEIAENPTNRASRRWKRKTSRRR
jgi:hypothetical protein